MSGNRPEMPENCARNNIFAADIAEIADINREFLQLLLHPDITTSGSVLGLHAGILEALRRLDPEQLETVASVPLLLAEFSPMPGFNTDFDSAIADCEPPFAATSESWRQDVQGFVDRLLVCIWQAARRDAGFATLCMGIDVPMRRKVAQLNFAGLRRYSRHATVALRARFAAHSAFWPDLLASAYGNDPLRRTVSQLSAIQLSVAGHTDARHRVIAKGTYQ